MQEPITVRETFLSRDEAEEARERLEYGGFARNGMNIMRVGDQFESSIRTRLENRQRAQECLDEVSGAFETGWYGREVSEYTPSPPAPSCWSGLSPPSGRVFITR